MSDYQKLFNRINLSISVESIYTSYFRNCIILFSFGLTIIGLAKDNETNKKTLGLIIILGGIILGFISIYEYNKKINLIKEERYQEYPLNVSNTIYIVGGILLLFSVLFGIRFINMKNNEKLLF